MNLIFNNIMNLLNINYTWLQFTELLKSILHIIVLFVILFIVLYIAYFVFVFVRDMFLSDYNIFNSDSLLRETSKSELNEDRYLEFPIYWLEFKKKRYLKNNFTDVEFQRDCFITERYTQKEKRTKLSDFKINFLRRKKIIRYRYDLRK